MCKNTISRLTRYGIYSRYVFMDHLEATRQSDVTAKTNEAFGSYISLTYRPPITD